MNEVNQLYDHGYGGAGKSLIKFGIALIMIPEPFMVSDMIVAESSLLATCTSGLYHHPCTSTTYSIRFRSR